MGSKGDLGVSKVHSGGIWGHTLDCLTSGFNLPPVLRCASDDV